MAELRVHAQRRGLQQLWDTYVSTWIKETYGKDLPQLPVDAELHLTSPVGPGQIATGRSPPPGTALRLPGGVGDNSDLDAFRSVIQEELGKMKEEIALFASPSMRQQPQDRAPVGEPRACGVRDASAPPKWLKELSVPEDAEEVDPFGDGLVGDGVGQARASIDPRGSTESAPPDRGATPHASDAGEDAPAEASALTDLVSGVVPANPWQFNPYDRDSTTWLAAAQRRHQHRRRSNAMFGVAAVDLSGPHEATPMIGQ